MSSISVLHSFLDKHYAISKQEPHLTLLEERPAGLHGLYLHVVQAENLILSRVRAKSIHQRLFGEQASHCAYRVLDLHGAKFCG